MKNTEDKISFFLFIFPSILLIVGLQIYPLLYSFFISFQDWVLLQSSEPQGTIGFDNYIYTFLNPAFLETLNFTFFLTATSVPIQLILGTCLALLISKNNSFHVITRAILVLPMVVAPVAVGTLWRLLYNDTAGPINNHFLKLFNIEGPLWLGDIFWAKIAVLIVEVWQWTPFVFIVITAALTLISQEIIQAAQIDGATRLQIFIKIEMPLLLPAYALIIMFRTLESLLTLDSILSLTKGGPGSSTLNLTYFIYNKGLREFDLGVACAASWIFMLFAILIICAIYKLIIKSEDY